MEQLKKYITIDRRFQKSVNLYLDLGDRDRINSYIPTHSSLLALKYYLKNFLGKQTEHATIFIGPYGKGKSHLLLLLLAFLGCRQECFQETFAKIRQMDPELADMVKQMCEEKKKFLPVLVSGHGNDLNWSFLYALKEALEREGLSQIVLASDYSEAVKTLAQWQKEYPSAYRQWENYLAGKGETSSNIRKRLNGMDRAAMELFLECYPSLTAGSRFLPMVQSEAMRAYQEVGRELRERHGYAGMVLVFDEFSKYVEGHGKENFARDMKTLQDMCELANSQGEQNLHLVLVAHKSIHEYGKGIDKSVKDAFLGVEGRLKEVRFHVPAKDHYELIANTLGKKEPEFSEVFEAYKSRTGFGEIAGQSFCLQCFSGLFQEYGQYRKVVEKGCFPLAPVCAWLLLQISEKAAQNERTVFTFLAGREQKGLPARLKEAEGSCIGADVVYDYFKSLFQENNGQPKIHNEWLKAEYALKQTENPMEKKVVKALALLRMAYQENGLSVVDDAIRLSLGVDVEAYQKAMQALKQRGIVMFRSSLGSYAFKNNIGLDVEKEIAAEVMKQPEKFSTCRYLRQISELHYVLPKQYNQEQNMTRYFQYEFINAQDFFQLDAVSVLFEEEFSDGKILALISEGPINKEQVKEKIESLQDGRVVALVPKQPFDMVGQLRKLAAIYNLKGNPKFIEDNQALVRELELYEEDIVFEVNVSLERDFLPGNGACYAAYGREPLRQFENNTEFNRFLCEICGSYYKFSPIVNHELLNIQHVSGQYLRARNKVVAALLKGQAAQYQEGTAPECMVYRAALVRTGIVDPHYREDDGCRRILNEIDAFLLGCIGQRKAFLQLYQKLLGKDYGIRKGIMPLFLAYRLGMAEGVPVIYLQGKELEVDEGTLNKVNDFPEDFALYLEPESGKKEQYLHSLEQAWQVGRAACSRQGRWAQLIEHMQKWYRSLPKYTMVTKKFPVGGEKAQQFRNLLKRSQQNPRELLFEQIPEIMAGKEEGQSLPHTADALLHVKASMEQVFSNLQKSVIEDICKIYGGKMQESLKGCLISWYQGQQAVETEYIFKKEAYGFLKYLGQLEENDELEIVSRLSRIVMGISMEDWNDHTPEQFREKMEAIKKEVEGAVNRSQETGKRTIILLDEQGRHIKRSYEAGALGSTSNFLKNMIDEAMEDFEDTLETSQKVAVLAEVLQGLLE